QERESVRRLEDLDRIKNRFIGTVSHEMRTSASAISGFANLLSSRWDRLDDGERRDLVIRIDRNGQSLVSVVEDFLDFSRLERRSPASDPPPTSLSDLVATAVLAGTHGAGIGLAVVKEVVDRLRARVSVEDSPSGGARLAVAFRGVSSPVSRSALVTGVRDDH